MMIAIYRSLLTTLLLAFICCAIYPLAVTAIGTLLFPTQARGSFIQNKDGKPLGSKLIGQAFSRPEYFHGRPSAAGLGYDASNSGGSNLGPTNRKLINRISNKITQVLMENPTLNKGEIPTELVTTSASGLDPHISPGSAIAQIERVAKARGTSTAEIQKLVAKHIQGPQLGVFGEPVINVLLLNLDLNLVFPQKTPPG